MEARDIPVTRSHLELEEAVRRRAHEIWHARQGRGGGSELEDWLQAEREVLGTDRHQPAQDRGTVVGDARAAGPDGPPPLGSA